jgi:hypothetical protein
MAMTPAQKQAAYRERQRLKAIGQLPASPGACNIPAEKRWSTALSQALRLMEQTRDEMQAYTDDRTEQWQESERGEAMQERIDSLSSVIDDLADAATTYTATPSRPGPA